LRRIQGEWKDAVQAGIAFDWKKGKPVSRRRKSKTSSTAEEHDAQQQQEQHVWVGPLSKNIWIWHFSVTGVPGSVFGDGIYHGRIVLPSNYPAQPPRIQVWTPSGRFVPRADICLSASSYHPESWSASWTIRTLVEALRLHMITPAQEIGGINQSYEERLAKVAASRSWRCRISPSIIVDHAHMVAQGLFPAPIVAAAKAKANDDPSESEQQQQECTIAPTDGETAANAGLAPQKVQSKQKRRRRQQQVSGSGSTATATATIPIPSQVEKTLPAVASFLTSLLNPVRLSLLGFAILYFILNR
jgi:ubiquitin-protein ligase